MLDLVQLTALLLVNDIRNSADIGCDTLRDSLQSIVDGVRDDMQGLLTSMQSTIDTLTNQIADYTKGAMSPGSYTDVMSRQTTGQLYNPTINATPGTWTKILEIKPGATDVNRFKELIVAVQPPQGSLLATSMYLAVTTKDFAPLHPTQYGSMARKIPVPFRQYNTGQSGVPNYKMNPCVMHQAQLQTGGTNPPDSIYKVPSNGRIPIPMGDKRIGAEGLTVWCFFNTSVGVSCTAQAAAIYAGQQYISSY